MVSGIILSIIPFFMFIFFRFGLKDPRNYEEKASTISGRPDFPLAKKLKKRDERIWYFPIAILWIFGLFLKWIVGW